VATESKPVAAADAAPKKSKKLLLLAVAAVVLLGGAGAGAWLYLKPQKAAGEAGAADAQHAEAAAPKAAPQYYKFDPAFVVNFGSEGNSHYLQITLEAMSRDPQVVEAIKANEPAVRNDLILLFSSQNYDQLLTAEGKTALREQTLAAIRHSVGAEGAKPEAVEQVYFTSFVIQ
jgi:flagellar FliL protein